MSWATTAGRTARACLVALGDPVTLQLTSGNRSVACVLVKRSEPVLSGGLITIDEDRYSANVAVADLTAVPPLGTRIVAADGAEYLIDQPPIVADGLYQLTLRRVDTG